MDFDDGDMYGASAAQSSSQDGYQLRQQQSPQLFDANNGQTDVHMTHIPNISQRQILPMPRRRSVPTIPQPSLVKDQQPTSAFQFQSPYYPTINPRSHFSTSYPQCNNLPPQPPPLAGHKRVASTDLGGAQTWLKFDLTSDTLDANWIPCSYCNGAGCETCSHTGGTHQRQIHGNGGSSSDDSGGYAGTDANIQVQTTTLVSCCCKCGAPGCTTCICNECWNEPRFECSCCGRRGPEQSG